MVQFSWFNFQSSNGRLERTQNAGNDPHGCCLRRLPSTFPLLILDPCWPRRQGQGALQLRPRLLTASTDILSNCAHRGAVFGAATTFSSWRVRGHRGNRGEGPALFSSTQRQPKYSKKSSRGSAAGKQHEVVDIPCRNAAAICPECSRHRRYDSWHRDLLLT